MYCLFTSQVYELSEASSSVNETFNESSMNASMAEDIDDCMALLEEAEKKVRHDSSFRLYSHQTSAIAIVPLTTSSVTTSTRL